MIKAVVVYDPPRSGVTRISRKEPRSAAAGASARSTTTPAPGTNGAAGALFGFASAAALAPALEVEITSAFRAQLVCLFGSRAVQPQYVVLTNWAEKE